MAANLVTRVVARLGVQDIVEVYDSLSASRVMRWLACHKAALEGDVRDRVAIFRECADLRLFTLQTDREVHQEADGLSKVDLLGGGDRKWPGGSWPTSSYAGEGSRQSWKLTDSREAESVLLLASGRTTGAGVPNFH